MNGTARCSVQSGLLKGTKATKAGYSPVDTLWVPVTFYDYRADGSNPDFEPANYTDDMAGRRTGMVMSALPGETPKPVLLADKAFNSHLNQWFRPSGGTEAQFAYLETLKAFRWANLKNYKGRPDEWVGADFDSSDPMATIVIYDSLPFLPFDIVHDIFRFADTAFFPLDGRGFGTEPHGPANPDSHNFGFAMEIHLPFFYQKGLNFSDGSEGDSWAFVNNMLAIDLGGFHGPLSGSFSLDTLGPRFGMELGEIYANDFFFAQRRRSRSQVEITMGYDPVGVLVLKGGAPPICAGDVVVDFRHDDGSDLQWEFRDKQPGDTLYNTTGDTVRFSAIKAWRSVHLAYSARRTFPAVNWLTCTDTVLCCSYYVYPASPTRVSIQPLTDDSVVSSAYYNTDAPMPSIGVPINVSMAKAYAVLRDRFGNYAYNASEARWTTPDSDKITVAPDSNRGWIGIITCKPVFQTVGDTVLVIASQDSLVPDTVKVVLNGQAHVIGPQARAGFSAELGAQVEVRIYSATGRMVNVIRTGAPGDWRGVQRLPEAAAIRLPRGMYVATIRDAGGMVVHKGTMVAR